MNKDGPWTFDRKEAALAFQEMLDNQNIGSMAYNDMSGGEQKWLVEKIHSYVRDSMEEMMEFKLEKPEPTDLLTRVLSLEK